MTLDLLSLLIGLLIGLAAGALFYLWRGAALKARLDQMESGRAGLDNEFQALAAEALRRSNEAFLQLAGEKLKQAQAEGLHDFEKRQKAISDLVDPISKTLKDMESKVEGLGKAGAGIESQLKTFAEDQRLLRQETQNLVRTLRNPAARGQWGEMQFQRALEMIGMVEGTHYVQQVSVGDQNDRRRPDFVIHLPGGLHIVIDVKAPVEPYWAAMEGAQGEAERDAALNSFRQHIRTHLKTLGSKEYWRSFDSPEFVVMFLPTEGLYALAVSGDPALIEDAARQNVILASPTTIMGLLRVAMYGWQQQALAEEAKTVSALAAELYRRIGTFGEHMQKVGTNLSRAMGAYNQAVGSLESSVLPGARKFKDLHIQTGGKDIPALEALEDGIRTVASPELLQSGDDDTPRKVANS